MRKDYVRAGNTWSSDFYFRGRRIRQSFGKCTEQEAQLACDRLKVRLQEHVPSEADKRNWKQAVNAWREAEPRSESDVYSLLVFNGAFPDRPLIACTADELYIALNKLQVERAWSNATFNRYLGIVSAVCQHSSHTVKMKKKNVPKSSRFRVLEGWEWEKLYATLSDYLKPMAKFGMYTGLRQSNVTQLRWDHIDLKREMMWVDPEDAKAGEAIVIPLESHALEVLRDQRKKIDRTCDYVFPYQGRRRRLAERNLPVKKIKLSFYMAMERAGLGYFERTTSADGKKHRKWHGNVMWHTMRHTWATWQRIAGTPLEDIKELGGWKDDRSVKRYAKSNVEHLRKAAHNVKPWNNVQPDNETHPIAAVVTRTPISPPAGPPKLRLVK